MCVGGSLRQGFIYKPSDFADFNKNRSQKHFVQQNFIILPAPSPSSRDHVDSSFGRLEVLDPYAGNHKVSLTERILYV